MRLCFGSSDRIPKWLLPVDPGEPRRRARPVRLSAATVASWARYAEGVDEQGEPIDVQDQLADTLVPLARSQHENPTAFIENTEVFGDLAVAAAVRRGVPVGVGLAAPRRCARDAGDVASEGDAMTAPRCTTAGAGDRRGADRHRRARRQGHRRARRRQPTECRGRTGAAGPWRRLPHPHRQRPAWPPHRRLRQTALVCNWFRAARPPSAHRPRWRRWTPTARRSMCSTSTGSWPGRRRWRRRSSRTPGRSRRCWNRVAGPPPRCSTRITRRRPSRSTRTCARR